MAGDVKRILDKIIQTRSAGNPALVNTTKTKLILKGLDPDKFSSSSSDTPDLIAKAKSVAAELGIAI
jgi:hypothetical protein